MTRRKRRHDTQEEEKDNGEELEEEDEEQEEREERYRQLGRTREQNLEPVWATSERDRERERERDHICCVRGLPATRTRGTVIVNVAAQVEETTQTSVNMREGGAGNLLCVALTILCQSLSSSSLS